MANPQMMKMVAPAASMGAAWATRRAISSGYQKVTGSEPPRHDAADVPLRRVLTYTMIAAIAAAVVNVIVLRVVANLVDDHTDEASE